MKKLAVLLLTAVVLLGLSAARADGRVFVSWYSFDDAYLSGVRAALDAEFAARGIAVDDEDAEGLEQLQIDDANGLLLSGADALLINLVDSGDVRAARRLMDVARALDVPAVFFNRSVSADDAEAAALFLGYGKSAYVGTDFEGAGRLQGQMIGEYLTAHFDEADLNGDGVISYVLFKGAEGNRQADARTRLARETADALLAQAGRPALRFYDAGNASQYLADLNGAWSNVASCAYMEDILAEYNAENGNMVELIICNNDDMAVGAVNALAGAGYNTGAPGAPAIPVFGVDAIEEARALIRQGRMTGTVLQDGGELARTIAQVTANLLAGAPALEGLDKNITTVDGWFAQIPYAPYTGE